MRGGYQLINLQHNDFTVDGAGVTVTGVHDIITRCQYTTKKEILIGNYTIDGAERPQSAVRFIEGDGQFEGIITSIRGTSNTVEHYFITVTSADLITITEETVTGQA